MPLDPSGLQSAIQQIMEVPPSGSDAVSKMAKAWAKAYDDYATGMLSVPSGVTLVSSQPSAIESALAALPPGPVPMSWILQFNLGLVAYWAAAVFSTPGTDVSVANGAPVVAPPTLVLPPAPVPSAAAAAAIIAAAIHAWTILIPIVTVSATGSPVPNVPS
ncbi:MAG: hypothetical protein ACYDHY_07460 [Acidiferrobacterales bacterium]